MWLPLPIQIGGDANDRNRIITFMYLFFIHTTFYSHFGIYFYYNFHYNFK